ncbi:MAG TPA: hypothetical protein VIL46_12980, partial [Gemmataceae bacterium]
AVLYGQRLTDEATCYKVLRTDLLRSLRLEASRFELCPEMTAKLCRLGVRIREEPISYRPRTAAEGKKIGWADAVQAVWTLLRWRFARVEFGKCAAGGAGGPARPSSGPQLTVESVGYEQTG